MADENGDVKQASLEDSNMSNYGSKEHKDLRKGAAQSEKEFIGAGQKVGLEIWRVENRRTKDDKPDFGVKRWPKEDYGSFYSGDSYLVLNTYRVKVDGKETDKLAWDVHFWLGKESSQDEIGVAAYKAVELDDLLDDGPVQHRETQGNESALFQSYFKGIQYMEGGIASGFRQVKPEEYKPRLFQVRRTRKAVRAFEVPVKASAMNNGDVFILDAGLQVYMFIGEHANAFEKMKGGALASNIVSARKGKAKFFPEVDDAFWKIVGGSIADIQPASEDQDEDQSDKPIDADKVKLFRLSDSSGAMKFSKEAEGRISEDQLDGNDVFVVDCDIEIFVWVGKGASASEKSQYATEYLAKMGKPSTIPITRIMQGQIHHVFGSVVTPKKNTLIKTMSSGNRSSIPAPAPKADPARTYSTSSLRPASVRTTSPPTSAPAAPAAKSSFAPTYSTANLRPASGSFPKAATAPSSTSSSSSSTPAFAGIALKSSGSSAAAAKPAPAPTAAASAPKTEGAPYSSSTLKSSGKKLW